MDTTTLIAHRLHQLQTLDTRRLFGKIPPMWPFAFMVSDSGDTHTRSTRIIEHTATGPHILYYTAFRLAINSHFTECRFAIEDDPRTHFEITAFIYKDRFVGPFGLGDIFVRALLKAGWLKRPWTWLV